MGAQEQTRLIANIVDAMRDVPRAIQIRQIGHFLKADRDYGKRVARGLGVDIGTIKAA